MLTARERHEIRKCIEKAEHLRTEGQTTAEVCSLWGDVAQRDVPRLLKALDEAEAEIDQLSALVNKLYKIVNLATLTECDHRCLTKETQGQIFALLNEARAVIERE